MYLKFTCTEARYKDTVYIYEISNDLESTRCLQYNQKPPSEVQRVWDDAKWVFGDVMYSEYKTDVITEDELLIELI